MLTIVSVISSSSSSSNNSINSVLLNVCLFTLLADLLQVREIIVILVVCNSNNITVIVIMMLVTSSNNMQFEGLESQNQIDGVTLKPWQFHSLSWDMYACRNSKPRVWIKIPKPDCLKGA